MDRPVAILSYLDKDYEIFVPGRGARPFTMGVITLDGRTVGVVRNKEGFTDVRQVLDYSFDYLNKM